MKFNRITLSNMFAYDGEYAFNLSDTTQEKNVVLIWGRNGMGKTSFLNAVKLFFTGMEDSKYRTVGFPGHTLPHKQFVLGDNARWTGVINRRARLRKIGQGEPVEARVSIEWVDDTGETCTGVRWWTLEGEDLSYGVYVDRVGDRIAAGTAEEFLAGVLPPDLVRFFFFDGEDIKSLAESTGSLQSDFDKLLRITFVEDLAREIETLASERRERNVRNQLRQQVNEAQAALAKAQTSQLNAEDELADIEVSLSNDGIELRRLHLRKANLSSGASEVQRKALEQKKKELQDRIGELTDRIVVQVPFSIPLLGNLRLLRQLASQVEAKLVAGSSSEHRFVRAVSSQLTEWVQEADSELSPEQAEKISNHVADRLQEAVAEVQPSGLFVAADPLVMERVRRSLEHWLSVGEGERESLVRDMLDVHRDKLQLHEVAEALLHLEVGSQANVEEYRAVTNRIEELEGAVANYNQRKGVLSNEAAAAISAQVDLKARIEALLASQEQAAADQARTRYLLKLVKALNDIGESLKSATRTSLEETINDRFKRIIDHPLIDRIGIDDTYVMTYYEKGGRQLGRTSLSSGMKQLVATALLWALKDSAGVKMPVIIDTPLGRIDRENQDHLLIAYYPVLSHQVLILPTNAEMDARKRALLEPHVKRH
jgi:DNA sulfur modification protein DndD